MKKRLSLFIICVLLFQLFSVPFLYVEAGDTEQPVVCNGPSEMMSYYFDFQGEMKFALLGSEINSERFSASFGPGGLFTNRVLTLSNSSTGTALDLLSSSVVANLRSFVSNSITSLFLIELATFSVVQSSVEGIAILFEDWPIVRDFKTMQDIESDLFDVAYFRSKQIDLTYKIDSNLSKNIKQIVKKYQDIGLLAKSKDDYGIGSMGDVLIDLVRMNAAMKKYITLRGKTSLYNYYGCLGNVDINACDGSSAILKFNRKAIEQLALDYTGMILVGGCNSYGNNIMSSLKKITKNGSDTTSQAMQDMKNAVNRLGDALFTKKRWDLKDPCKDLSEYEMVQLQAYRGGNWECGYGINPFTTKRYIKDKIAHSKQNNNSDDEKYNDNKDSNNVNDKMKELDKPEKRALLFRKETGLENYNIYYDSYLGDAFFHGFNGTMNEFLQAQNNATATDVSTLFLQIKGVLAQLDTVIRDAGTLKKNLKKIESEQCKN